MKESDKHPHFVILPKNSISPTGSIYKRYDIVRQTRVLWTKQNGNTIRCAHPFTVKVLVNGKVKEIKSRIK